MLAKAIDRVGSLGNWVISEFTKPLELIRENRLTEECNELNAVVLTVEIDYSLTWSIAALPHPTDVIDDRTDLLEAILRS